MYDIQKRIEEESLLAVPIFTDIKGNDCNRHKRADWVDGCNCGVGIMLEMIQHMKDNGLEVVITNTDPIDESEWKELEFGTESYELALDRTQNMKPIDYGSTLDSRYATFEFGDCFYELSWDILLTNSRPIIKRKRKTYKRNNL